MMFVKSHGNCNDATTLCFLYAATRSHDFRSRAVPVLAAACCCLCYRTCCLAAQIQTLPVTVAWTAAQFPSSPSWPAAVGCASGSLWFQPQLPEHAAVKHKSSSDYIHPHYAMHHVIHTYIRLRRSTRGVLWHTGRGSTRHLLMWAGYALPKSYACVIQICSGAAVCIPAVQGIALGMSFWHVTLF